MRIFLSGALIVILLIMLLYPGKATFAGSHTMYETRNGTTTNYKDAYFCSKCHQGPTDDIFQNSAPHTAHNSTTCLCHGYYPNNTLVRGPYGLYGNISVNLKHNLTYNIYCTNCHTNYNSTGGIKLGNGMVGTNQSAHYINFDGTDPTSIIRTYNRSKAYFVNNSFL
jgi:hypothetical protein